MSDVTVAPPSAAPTAPAPAPAASEVPINQTPQSSPNPIGSQAPEKPANWNGPEGRKEAIQRAFDRANNPQAKAKEPPRPAPKPAEAKAGHNQPPEETPKLNLKKRPEAQDETQATPRGERGRFAPRQAAANDVNAQVRSSAVNAGQPGQNNLGHAQNAQNAQLTKLPPHAPYPEPLQRMAESAKRDWAVTPETVRGDVHRMHAEFKKASDYYKATHEVFKSIAKYHQMAVEQGTTLDKALGNFVSIENKLRQDPIAGLDTIVNNLNITDPQTGQRLGLRDIAWHVVNQSPEQLRQIQMGNQQQAAGHQIGALHQEIQGLKQTLQQMHTQQQFTYTRSAVDQFAETHPRFDEVGDAVRREVELGFDIDTAYKRACLLQPAAQAEQIRTTPAQTRTPDRSIHGAPSVTASNAASRRPKEPSPTARDAVKNALQRLNGVH